MTEGEIDRLLAWRDKLEDAVADAHLALGGSGEWTNMHDLSVELPVLAEEAKGELDALSTVLMGRPYYPGLVDDAKAILAERWEAQGEVNRLREEVGGLKEEREKAVAILNGDALRDDSTPFLALASKTAWELEGRRDRDWSV